MEQQHKYYIQWRKKMRGRMIELANGANPHDLQAIGDADNEFAKEVRLYENWSLHRYQKADVEQFSANPEWADIETYWKEASPSSAITDLFDYFVHDSRACFRPFNKGLDELQYEMEKLVKEYEDALAWNDSRPESQRMPCRLSKEQKALVEEYQSYKRKHPEKQDYSEAIMPQSGGQEPVEMGGGYLRYRKIYMGSDWYKPSGAKYAGLDPLHGHKEFDMAYRKEDAEAFA